MKKSINPAFVRILYIVIGSLLSLGVLAFSLLAISTATEDTLNQTATHLLFAFICLGLVRLTTFIKERSRLAFIRFLVLFVLDVALGITVLFAKDNLRLFSVTAGLYCLSIVIGRIFSIVENHTLRNIIYNGIIIVLAIALAIGLFVTGDIESTPAVVIIECIIMAGSAILEVLISALSRLKFKVLFKIITRTFALEIILGLLVCIAAFSLIIMRVEEDITNFPDALWYCFAVVTTIGFGDFTTKTLIGRILTVILGAYGIIVVAVLTSIVVNFYNETEGKKDNKEMKEIKQEENKDKK